MISQYTEIGVGFPRIFLEGLAMRYYFPERRPMHVCVSRYPNLNGTIAVHGGT
jgi:hypothetical protein